MRKDIKWLKEEVERQNKGYIYKSDLFYLIDKLDEPEVLSKEWIDEHITDGHNVNLGEKVVYADELDGLLVPNQELPVIPQFVADWWGHDGDSVTMYEGVRIEKKHKLDLVSCFQDRGLIDSLSKVEVWIDENESTFLDLVNGKPYEVEKEQKYYTLDSEDIPLLERANNQTCKTTTGLSIYEDGRDNSRFELTEKEIKDYDERFWPFAVEVEK